MVQSVRAFDTQREFVVMTAVPEAELHVAAPATVDTNLQQLQRAFAPLLFEAVPFLSIFNRPNKTCLSMSLGGCGMGTAKAYASGSRPPTKQHYDSYVFSYTKFAMWNLTSFDKIFYLDNDVLVMQSLEGLWAAPLGTRNLAAAAMAIRASTYKGVSEYRCNPDGSLPKGVNSGHVKFNAGVQMLEPSALLYAAIRRLMRNQWMHSYKTPCTSDQRYWNILLAKNRMHCWPLSANCRDPQFIERQSSPDPNAPVSKLSRCLESAPPLNGTLQIMLVPYMVHMACNSKPWLPKNKETFFAVEWRRHLDSANRKLRIAADSLAAPGNTQLPLQLTVAAS